MKLYKPLLNLRINFIYIFTSVYISCWTGWERDGERGTLGEENKGIKERR